MAQLKICELKATEASKLLNLNRNDPAVWLYQAIEFYENQQYQASLPLFILAAQNRILHAIPYINKLSEKGGSRVKMTAQQRLVIEDIKSWSCVLVHSEIDITSYFHVSESIIRFDNAILKEQRQASKKSKKSKKSSKSSSAGQLLKKSKAQAAKEKYFKNAQSNSAHFFYHFHLNYGKSNLVPQYLSACSGHLVAVAGLLQVSLDHIPDQLRSVYGDTLCSSEFHQVNQMRSFSDRLYVSVVKQSEPRGKADLHFESVRLGVIDAFNMVAKLYYLDDSLYDAALALLYLGVYNRGPQARLSFSLCLPKASENIKKLLPHIDHNAVISMLIENLTGEYHDHYIHDESRHRQEIIEHLAYNTAVHLNVYLVACRNDQQLLSTSNFVERIEVAVNQYDDNYKISTPIYQALHQITSRQINLTKSFAKKVQLADKTIYFLDKCVREQHNIKIAHDKLLMMGGRVKNLRQVDGVDNDILIIECEKLMSFVRSIEEEVLSVAVTNPFDEKQVRKFVQYAYTSCRLLYFAYRPMINKPHNFKKISPIFVKYQNLGIQFNMLDCVVDAAKYLINIEKNHLKAQELFASFEGEHNEWSILLAAFAYFDDPQSDSEKGVAVLEESASKKPALYNMLGDFFYYGSIGVQQNVERAREYYVKGDKYGCLDATLSLGILASEDYGTASLKQKPALREATISYFQHLIDRAHPDGFYFLGKMYFDQWCDVPQDIERAKHYFTKAVEIGDHTEAGCQLAMMAEGYTGGSQTVPQLLVKYQYLNERDKLDCSSSDLCGFGVLLLSTNQPEAGLEYILKAARFNATSAQALIASFQLLCESDLIEFKGEIMSSILEYDTAPFHQNYSKLQIPLAFKNCFEFSRAVKSGINDGREISFDYFIQAFTTTILSVHCDVAEEVRLMYREFPDTERKKILLLASKQRHPNSGDKVCADYTETLMMGASSSEQNILNNIKSLRKGESKLSEHNIRVCLEKFLRSSAKPKGENKKAISAIEKIHWHHGDGSHKGNDEVEGGRQKTVLLGLGAMQRATEQLMADRGGANSTNHGPTALCDQKNLAK